MGHALAPGVFQRFSDAIIRHVFDVLEVKGVAYLDDWLFFHEDPNELLRVPDYISHLGLTINFSKSITQPTTQLVYLGFLINTEQHTIKLTLPAYDRMKFLLRHTRKGSDKDRQRIAGYASWILFNLRWPFFLSRDILLGDASWLLAAMDDLRILRPRPILDAPMTISAFSDATPHSIAGIIPQMNISFAQAFTASEEINHAETVAAIQTIVWACEELVDTHIKLYVDNATALSALRSGRGRVMRSHAIRRLFLSMLHNLGSNTFEVQPILGVDNPADAPSRDVLNTLLAAPVRHQAGLLPHLGEGWLQPTPL